MKLDIHLQKRSQFEEAYKLVGFALGSVRYGIDIMRIREIVHPIPYVEVPAGPPHMIGVTDHRETVVPVVDLRLRFGLPAAAADMRRTKWIIVKVGGRDVALVVDQVTQVLKMTPAERRDQGALLTEKQTPWVRNVYADQEGLVFELDLDEVVGGHAELQASMEDGGQ
ncbi:MAG: chemotaxis protein CheW [Myxococcota bacterium]|nr:chemotaxis protein CheW [Myxococcota bacterium]